MSVTIEEELIQIRAQVTALFDVVEILILRLQEHPQDSDSSDSDSSGYSSSSHHSLPEIERFLAPSNSLETIDLSPELDSESIAVPELLRESGRYIRQMWH